MSALSNALVKSVAEAVGHDGISDDVAAHLGRELEFRIRELIQVQRCIFLQMWWYESWQASLKTRKSLCGAARGTRRRINAEFHRLDLIFNKLMMFFFK